MFVKTGPVSIASLYEQPVIPQTIGNRTSIVPGQVGINFLLTGIAQIGFEKIIVDIRRNRIIFQTVGQPGCTCGIFFTCGISKLPERFVLGRCRCQIPRGFSIWKNSKRQDKQQQIPESCKHRNLSFYGI